MFKTFTEVFSQGSNLRQDILVQVMACCRISDKLLTGPLSSSYILYWFSLINAQNTILILYSKSKVPVLNFSFPIWTHYCTEITLTTFRTNPLSVTSCWRLSLLFQSRVSFTANTAGHTQFHICPYITFVSPALYIRQSYPPQRFTCLTLFFRGTKYSGDTWLIPFMGPSVTSSIRTHDNFVWKFSCMYSMAGNFNNLDPVLFYEWYGM